MATRVAESPPVPDPSRSIRVEDQRAWQILRTHYLISEGFALVLLTAPDEWTLSRIRAHLPELLPAGAALRDVGFESTFQPEVLTQEILGRNLPAHSAPQVWVEAPAPPVSSSDPAMEPWHAAFSYLNRHRNALPREIPGTLVIAGTPETIHALRESAPDLYSIRSTLLAFDPAPSEPGLSDQPAQKRQRLTAYRRALLAAFRPYQELAIDNFAAAEQAAPDIWDIFVHPACSKEYLRPEDMDIAQRETPPRMPAQDLLPLLAQDDYRRTVLLADPGMGKSTLIQSLIAHLASGRGFTGAAALTGLLPVPLILRDIVPLLPQDQVENWSWDSLLNILIERYQRDEAAPPLCDSFKDHRDEFRQIIHTDAKVFFLIDGLDEIGDIAKRRQIVHCIQDGIRAVSKEARWLITSRVIGYEDARVDIKFGWWPMDKADKNLSRIQRPVPWLNADRGMKKLVQEWRPWIIPGTGWEDEYPRVLRNIEPERSNQNEEWPIQDSNEPLLKLRGIGYGCRLPIAQRLYLVPFDDKRQDLFTQRWFQNRHSTDYSHELMREVRAHHHDGVRIISRVPNLLCMMNILKRSGKPLPDGRAALYDAIVQAYLGGIDAAYRLRPVLGNTCPFDAAQRRFLLSLLGAHMQQIRAAFMVATPEIEEIEIAETSAEMEGASFGADGNILISRPELEQLLIPAIQRLLEERRMVSDHTTTELLDELLYHIASRSGLLIPRSSDVEGNTVYGFTHLSFLEFFAAEWLSLEYDRQRNRIVRRTLAQEEGQTLSDAELDHEFPPHGPIQHTRESFRDLPAITAWHEPIIFLLESRKADTPTLLRWLFPALHSHQPHVVSKRDQNPTPLLPLDAVRLAVNLTQDPEIHLPKETRQQWWRRLWFAYLTWPFHPTAGEKPTQWPIAPLLINNNEHRPEVLKALIEVYSSSELTSLAELPPEEKTGSQAAKRHLILFDCVQLTSSDLSQLTILSHLERLLLSNCKGLETLPDLSNLKNLSTLLLVNCSGLHGDNAFDALSKLTQLKLLIIRSCPGLTRLPELGSNKGLSILDLVDNTELHGPEALRGLTGLTKLFHLNLSRCTKLEQLPDLRSFKHLKYLKLNDCNSLKGVQALGGLYALSALENLEITGCTGLTKDDVAELQRNLSKKCKITAST
ncbi:MAG: NACHT domain-containing protein [Verrucomicrobia bacterium]|nr:NACHT domain-containing protein [Verrucomicrobiota bacterium]